MNCGPGEDITDAAVQLGAILQPVIGEGHGVIAEIDHLQLLLLEFGVLIGLHHTLVHARQLHTGTD